MTRSKSFISAFVRKLKRLLRTPGTNVGAFGETERAQNSPIIGVGQL